MKYGEGSCCSGIRGADVVLQDRRYFSVTDDEF